MEQQKSDLARYEEIALTLAREITQGMYMEGDKISGRSIIAGRYNISPETVRKALALLQSKQVVEVIPNSGTVILSRVAAQSFVGSFEEHNSLDALEHRLANLTKQRNKINIEIEKIVKEILHFKAGMLKSMQRAEEISICAGSTLLGKSLHEARLRSITGVTVTAVQHKGRWYVSPGADLVLDEGDLLLAVGAFKAVNHLRRLASGT